MTAADGYQVIRDYLPAAQVAHWQGAIAARPALFAPVAAKHGMNLPYRVVGGTELRRELPALAALADGPLLEAAERATGLRLEPMRDARRRVRLQCYRSCAEGFRWHLDGGLVSALLTLSNSNDGGTEVLTPGQSRWLRPVPYVLFPFPGVLELAGPRPIDAGAGDLLILCGGSIIHRGVTRRDGGERVVLVATYDPAGRRRLPLWDRVARWLNY